MLKKTLVFALAILLLAALSIPATAFASSNLGVSTTVTPEQLMEAGKVEIALKLANNGPSLLEDVTLSIPGKNDAVLGNLDPGEKKSFNISNFNVSAEQIGTAIAFRFKWVENGAIKSLEYPVTVGARSSNPKLEARRDVSKAIGTTGDIITVTYVLQNTGDVDLTDVTITDPISDKAIASGLTLAVGSAVKKVNYGLTLDKTVTSKPVVTAMGGSKEISVEIPVLDIVLAEPKLEIIATVGSTDGAVVSLDISIKNTGNTRLKDINLVDEQGKLIADGIALSAGEGQKITYEVSNAARTVVVTANATVEGLEGPSAKMTFLSAGVNVSPTTTAEPAVGDVLSVTVTPSASTIDAAGEVEFVIKLNNTGNAPIKSVILKEAAAGVIKEFTDLKMGITSVKAKINISKTTVIKFFAEYQDGETTKSAAAAPVNVEIGPGKAPATEKPQSGAPVKLNILTIIMIGLGVLLVGAVIGLVVVLSQERRRKEQRMEAEELDRMMEHRAHPMARREVEGFDLPDNPVINHNVPLPPRAKDAHTEPRRAPVQPPQRRYTPVEESVSERPAVERPQRTRPRPEGIEHYESIPIEQNAKKRPISDEELFEREFMDEDE